MVLKPISWYTGNIFKLKNVWNRAGTNLTKFSFVFFFKLNFHADSSSCE